MKKSVTIKSETNLIKYLLIWLILAVQFTVFSQDRFEYKKRQNRYEGVKAVGVSAPDLELLSFTAYRENVPADSNVILNVEFFMKSDTNLYITAKELVPQKFYLMKSIPVKWKAGWQIFTPWPTGEVINPLGIKFDEIGVVGRLYDDRIGSGYIVPLLLYYSHLVSSIKEYIIQLKSKESLSRLQYALYPSGSREAIISKVIHETYHAGEPFTISLDLSDQPAGEYQLIVKCRIRNKNGGPNRTYTFYHNPDVK